MLASGAAAHAASSHKSAEEEPPAEEKVEVPMALPPLPVYTAEEVAKQPFGLVRTLQAVQDQVALGSASGHAFQRRFIAQLNEELRNQPPAAWDDPRNARAAVIFVLSGGDPRIVSNLLSRSTPPPIDDRLLKAALAFGEGRMEDAVQFFDAIEVRTLDPSMAGLSALIHATIVAKKDPKKAILLFDDARLLAPGTLVEEAALRQEILTVAREGYLAKFDMLSSQYARRFPTSIYASNFRKQFFAGVARQDFKGTSEWISRTEAELMNLAPEDRGGAYLTIAEEATLGGNVVIGRFAAGKASQLSVSGSAERERARLYEGAALILTDDLEQGVETLKGVDRQRLRASDRDILDEALAMAGRVRKWPDAAIEGDKPVPPSIARANDLMTQVDTLLEGSSQ
jgi:chemotaxis protein MotC